VITDVAEGLGLVESDDLDLDYYIKNGTAAQKDAAKRAAKAMGEMLLAKPKDRDAVYARMVAATKELRQLIDKEADANGNANDASFTTNHENPKQSGPEDEVMEDERAPLNAAEREALAKKIAALTVRTAIGTKQMREAAQKELDAALKELEEYD